MANGKHLQQENRELIKDDSVPMKTKVKINAAMTADVYDLVYEMKQGQDKFIKDQSQRLAVVETKQDTNKEEIEKLRARSDRNDIFASMGTFLVAVATFFGINK